MEEITWHLWHIEKASKCSSVMEGRGKETTVDLGREDENYLFGLGFGKIMHLAMRLLLQHFISSSEEVCTLGITLNAIS